MEDGGMRLKSRSTSPRNLRRSLYAIAIIAPLASTSSYAENLDEGKSASRLFADSCMGCHHSARGLVKGRFRLTLFWFLRQHYASNSSSAWALTSYLESIDDGPRGRSRTAAAKSPTPVTSTARNSPRPPMPVR
jgi:hypothetical protein